MGKKIILLDIKRHHGEIDWILPLLYKFDRSYELITIFDFEKTFENFTKNKVLFELWNKRNKYLFIKKKRHKFFFKILYYLFKIFIKISKTQFLNFEEYLLDKITDLKSFLNDIDVEYTDIQFFFIASHNRAYLPNFIKKKNPKCKIVRFPESPWIFPSKEQNKNYNSGGQFKKNFGHYYLHTCKANSNFFLGKSKNIIYCKNFRYENWWRKKFYKKIPNNKFFNVLVATRPPYREYLSKESYEKIILSIIKAASQIRKSKIVFKIHPHSKELVYLKSILKKSRFNNWEINNNHAFLLANRADICITMITSTCLDFLSLKKPTLEFYFSNEDANEISVKFPHYAFNKKTKKWVSIFEYLGFLKTYKKSEDLVKIFRMVRKQKKNKIWFKYFNRFENWEKNKMDSLTLRKFLENKIN